MNIHLKWYVQLIFQVNISFDVLLIMNWMKLPVSWICNRRSSIRFRFTNDIRTVQNTNEQTKMFNLVANRLMNEMCNVKPNAFPFEMDTHFFFIATTSYQNLSKKWGIEFAFVETFNICLCLVVIVVVAVVVNVRVNNCVLQSITTEKSA